MVSVMAEPSSLAVMASNISTTLQSALPVPTAETVSSGPDESILTALGHVLYLIMRIIPGFVVWLAAFATFTLPAWVFTTFSMSLTFTMNVTTL